VSKGKGNPISGKSGAKATALLQDAGAFSGDPELCEEFLDCASPLALSIPQGQGGPGGKWLSASALEGGAAGAQKL